MTKKIMKKQATVVTKESIEEKYNVAIEGIKTITKVGRKKIGRIDQVFELRGAYYDLTATLPTVADIDEAVAAINKTYDYIEEVIHSLTFEQAFEGYTIDPIMDKFEEIASAYGKEDWKDLFYRFMIYQTLRPFGERIEQLLTLVQDEKTQLV